MKRHNISSILTELNIKNIFFDSRKVTKDSAFFCVQYAPHYILEAIEKGAALIVATAAPSGLEEKAVIIIEDDVRDALAEAAATLYPAKPSYIVAVTGTSGKSSVVDYFRQLATHLGYKAASIGTNGIICSDPILTQAVSHFGVDLTTPDVVTMHQILNFLASSGVTHVAFEASSHGIDQQRISKIPIFAAGFTSFSLDHLDYHNTMEAYKLAKLKLFSENLISGGTAIIADELMLDEDIHKTLSGEGLFLNEKIKVVTVGKKGKLQVLQTVPTITSQEIIFSYENKSYRISTSISGNFQANNLLIAAAMLECCDVNFDEIAPILSLITAVPGRLERITNGEHPWHVFVDYSHKPGALESSLEQMKILCANKLHVVFGCGGDRDKTKRKIMGEIADRIADYVIVTDDNPRTEDAASIRLEILLGCPGAKEIASRGEAIKYAISQLNKGDILLIAGKGNENYQIIGTEKIHFVDKEEVEKYL